MNTVTAGPCAEIGTDDAAPFVSICVACGRPNEEGYLLCLECDEMIRDEDECFNGQFGAGA